MDYSNITEDEWRERLSNKEFQILREKGTEQPFTGRYLENKEKGIYKCAGCETPLFTSDTKFNSQCGWPSFFEGIEEKIKTRKDRSHGMVRVEVLCKVCDGHLGHIFEDGPKPTGIRYCINGYSLKFEKIKS